MKNKLIVFVCSCIVMLLCASCNVNTAYSPDQMKKSLYPNDMVNQNIIMSVKESSVHPETEQLTLIITNKTNKEYNYGYEQVLEIKLDGIWYDVPMKKDAAWIELAVILSGQATQDMQFQFKNFYENLCPGEYRIIKTFYGMDGKETAAVQFTISA